MTGRRERQAKNDLIRRNERIRAGKCVDCGEPNDRAGEQTKAHKDATRCTACLDRNHAHQVAARHAARAKCGDIAAALGLTPAQAAQVTKRMRK